MKLLRFKDLKERGVVNNWPTLLNWIGNGHFPPGRKIGPNSRAWTEDEISEWYATRPIAERTPATAA
jgi:predicted DNA-binding transcriptional regulator AlpA